MDGRELIEKHKDKIINVSRHWNNSMYQYTDYIIVWEGNGKTSRHCVGIDFFDGFRFEVDTETEAWKEAGEYERKQKIKRRRERIKANAANYAHHGKLTAYRLAIWLETLRFKDEQALHLILKVKNFRSNFRRSLCNQILAWIKTRKPKYPFPLSKKQMGCLLNSGIQFRNHRGKLHRV